jgi:uncharacterized RDD family membrane protein YckC
MTSGQSSRICARRYMRCTAGRAIDRSAGGPRWRRQRRQSTLQPAEHGWNQRVTDLLLQALDVNAVVRRIDVNAVLDEVDLNELLKRVDLQALLDRVDVNDLLRRIDMDALVRETDLGAVIARSSGGMASEALDAVRSQAVGLDRFIGRWMARVLRRKADGARNPQRYYAGAVSRFTAYAIDLAVGSGLLALILAVISYAAQVVTGHSIAWSHHGWASGVISVCWYFLYFGYSWAVSGRTFGMAVLGLRVVRADGADIDPWRGVVRAAAFPLSFLLCGLGFAGILFQHEHRALHDLIAGTAVLYAWDARAARLRFLARDSTATSLGHR